jgi:DNA polymerase III delta prime subunit
VKQLFNDKPVAIIMDEIDSMSGGDNGGLGEIIHYVNPDRGKGNRKKEDREKRVLMPPLICICNDAGDRKLMDFHKDCLYIHFKKPRDEDLMLLLNRVCKAEKIKMDEDAKEYVIAYAQGDYRRLISYLQGLDSLIVNHDQILDSSNILECNSIIGEKSVDKTLEESVQYLLANQKLSLAECMKIYNNHKSQIVCSLYENYLFLLANNKNLGDPMKRIDKASRIMDDISASDMIDKVMHKNQLWYLHRVHGLLSCYLPISELKSENAMLKTSASRSKFNQQKNNEKDINQLSSKLKSTTGTTDVHILSQIGLHYMLDNFTEANYVKGVNFLKGYGLFEKDIKTLIKIDRLTPHVKGGHRFQKLIKTDFPTNGGGEGTSKKKEKDGGDNESNNSNND